MILNRFKEKPRHDDIGITFSFEQEPSKQVVFKISQSELSGGAVNNTIQYSRY